MTTPSTDRMPPLPLETMNPAQRAAADELIAGPRKAVRGPFIPLMRSPELLTRIQKVGEVLRFHSVLPARLTELVTLEAYSGPRKTIFRTRRVAIGDGPLSGRIGFAHSTYRKWTVERVLYHRVLSL